MIRNVLEAFIGIALIISVVISTVLLIKYTIEMRKEDDK